MYEENDNKIEWGPILKKVGIVVAVILVIFGIITLVSKCSRAKNDDSNNNAQIDLTNQLNELEKATLEYMNKDNVPTEINASKTVRLKILINKNLLTEIKDSDNNKCDVNDSYAEITRLENNYAVKLSVVCGKNNATKVVYVGCFAKCSSGSVCRGEETETGGICGDNTTEVDNKDSNSTNLNNNSSTNTSTNKPSNSNSSSTTKKPSTSTNGSNNSNSNTSNNNNSSSSSTTKGTLYEYKKCRTVYTCKNGKEPDSAHYCESTGTTQIIQGNVLKFGGQTVINTTKVPAQPSKKTSTVYFSSTSQAKNTSTVTYKYVGMMPNGTYKYTKTETVYSCREGQPSGAYCLVSKPTTTPISYRCEDPTFYFNAGNLTCTKRITNKTYVLADSSETCETTWSYSTSLLGWTRTGRTK